MAELVLTTFDDTLTGTAAADTFSGPGGGIDSLVGAAGDDTFVIDFGSIGSIDGGDGIDTVLVGYDLGTVLLSNVEVLASGSDEIQLTMAQLNAFHSATPLASPGQPRLEIWLTGNGGTTDLSARPDLGSRVQIHADGLLTSVTMIGSSGDDHLAGGLGVDNVI